MIFGLTQTSCTCGAQFAIPDALYTACKHSEAINFYCPYGHKLHYPKGETEADKLRRERDRLTQRLAQKDDAIAHERDRAERAEKSVSVQKGLVTRIKNRVGSGVCPCCTRSFGNLRRHMETEHPTFKAEEVAA